MAWHIYEKLLEGVANYSPFIGKVWITFLFMFRLIMVISIGDTIYGDEQSSFACNTLQPGCENICFNHFTPISQIRFYAVQILFVGTPSIMFIVYAMHTLSSIPPTNKQNLKRRSSQATIVNSEIKSKTSEKFRKAVSKSEKESPTPCPPGYEEVVHYGGKPLSITETTNKSLGSHSAIENVQDSLIIEEDHAAARRNELKKCIENEAEREKKDHIKLERKVIYQDGSSSEVLKTQGIIRAYAVQAVIRTIIESGFLYMQYRLYQFEVPELYLCIGFPCPREVECFVSRPMEKTLFMIFMYITTVLSLVLNFTELFFLASKRWRRRFRKRNGPSLSTNNDILPMEEIIIDNRLHQNQAYRRQVIPNTFPDLGPFPRHPDDVGDSDNNTIDSDYRFYDK